MVHLRLTGVSQDGRKLLLVSDAGVEFTVDVDDRLRAVLDQSPGGDQARLAQLEIQMDSTLRPRDIQARIRSGETPESVAQVAGTSVEKVMPYAAPVLAERAHVAQRAQRASIRRRPADGGGAERPDSRRRRRQPPPRPQRRPRHGVLGRLAARGRPLDADRLLHDRRPRRRRPLLLRRSRQLRRGRRRRRPLAARRGRRRPGPSR